MSAKSKLYPVAFGSGNVLCGCRFGYGAPSAPHGPGFLDNPDCPIHAAIWAQIAADRAYANANPIPLPFPSAQDRQDAHDFNERRTAEYEPPKGFHAEVARRTAAAAKARAEIKKPTHKLTQAERDHLHTFAFTAEQIVAELAPRKKGR